MHMWEAVLTIHECFSSFAREILLNFISIFKFQTFAFLETMADKIRYLLHLRFFISPQIQ